MKHKKCETCGESAPVLEVLKRFVYQRHLAPCGNICIVGYLNGSPLDLFVLHGATGACATCGPVQLHWARGLGQK